MKIEIVNCEKGFELRVWPDLMHMQISILRMKDYNWNQQEQKFR